MSVRTPVSPRRGLKPPTHTEAHGLVSRELGGEAASGHEQAACGFAARRQWLSINAIRYESAGVGRDHRRTSGGTDVPQFAWRDLQTHGFGGPISAGRPSVLSPIVLSFPPITLIESDFAPGRSSRIRQPDTRERVTSFSS